MFLSCKEEDIAATAPAEEQPVTLVNPWVANPAWKTRANSPGKCSAKSEVRERVNKLAKYHPKSNTHTHVCLILNYVDPFIKLFKAPKKEHFIKNPVISCYSK